MQVKKFQAPTLQEALEEVRKNLGPEAIILQTRRKRKGFFKSSPNLFEVTATISDRDLKKKNALQNRLGEQGRDQYEKMSTFQQAQVLKKYQTQLEKKVLEEKPIGEEKKSQKKYIDILDEEGPLSLSSSPSIKVNEVEKKRELPFRGSFEMRHPLLQDLFDQLIIAGLERQYAFPLIKKVTFDLEGIFERSKDREAVERNQPLFYEKNLLPFLAQEMEQQIRASQKATWNLKDIPSSPEWIACVGPSGVGKSSVIAKWAGQLKGKKKIGLMSFRPPFSLEEIDTLAIYSKLLNLPFRFFSNASELKNALSDFHSLEMIFLDTPGFSKKDFDWMKEVRKSIFDVADFNYYLVLSAATRDLEMVEAVSRMSFLNLQGLILTKMDEAFIYGGIYNLYQKTKIPLTFFSFGKKIPEDFEMVQEKKLIDLILNSF